MQRKPKIEDIMIMNDMIGHKDSNRTDYNREHGFGEYELAIVNDFVRKREDKCSNWEVRSRKITIL